MIGQQPLDSFMGGQPPRKPAIILDIQRRIEIVTEQRFIVRVRQDRIRRRSGHAFLRRIDARDLGCTVRINPAFTGKGQQKKEAAAKPVKDRLCCRVNLRGGRNSHRQRPRQDTPILQIDRKAHEQTDPCIGGIENVEDAEIVMRAHMDVIARGGQFWPDRELARGKCTPKIGSKTA